MRDTHAGKLPEILNTVIATESGRTEQHDITLMTCYCPLIDHRCNVIDIIIMTKKKKGFHPLNMNVNLMI